MQFSRCIEPWEAMAVIAVAEVENYHHGTYGRRPRHNFVEAPTHGESLVFCFHTMIMVSVVLTVSSCLILRLTTSFRCCIDSASTLAITS